MLKTMQLGGNVEWLVQKLPGLDAKLIRYSYDLISGKVRQVDYQPGYSDGMSHRYSYDDDNRLIRSESSRDQRIWEEDNQYSYYPHGPLKRHEIGSDQVQGIDYVYTLQGWLKSINHSRGISAFDPGNDSITKHGVDVYSQVMRYFDGDFERSGSNLGNSGTLLAGGAGLYNGNIAGISYHYRKPGSAMSGEFGYLYRYDELQRIKSATMLSGSNFTPSSMYGSTYSYDPNGNILSLQRRNESGTLMDNLSYSYKGSGSGILYQLDKVEDAITSPAFSPDINSGQLTGNYQYDQDGRLIKDDSAGLSNIMWNPDSKVKKITKSNNIVLEYLYDALGHRVQKRSFAGTAQQNRNWTIRDAQGNALATYEQDGINDPIQLKELPIYGSSRTGMHIGGTNPDTMSYGIFTRRLNKRNFEIQDHLGNVRAVVSDLKNPDNTAQVLNLNDYYPFGMISRKEESVAYRYGYNGKEKDDEIKGAGNSYDYGARFYDPRVGRWLSRDALEAKYPSISTYTYVANSPLMAKDPDGKVILFINGQHFTSGGSKEYWGNFAQNMKNKIGDQSARYVDGSSGGFLSTFSGVVSYATKPIRALWTSFTDIPSAISQEISSLVNGGGGSFSSSQSSESMVNLSVEDRIKMGKQQGMADAESIISKMDLANGETIKVVTHSMGAAFSRGYIEGIQHWAKSNNKNVTFEYILDIEAYQGDKLPVPFSVKNRAYKLGNSFIPPGCAAPPQSRDITTDSERNNGHSIEQYNTEGVPDLGNGGSPSDIEQGQNNEGTPK
jgi:RHS repeat-associated protein